MTELEKEVIKKAEERKAVYAIKRHPATIDGESVWFWIYFTDRLHYIVEAIYVTSYSVKYYEYFNSLEFNKEYLLKDLKIGMHQEQLDI